jgi:hypothetical protein
MEHKEPTYRVFIKGNQVWAIEQHPHWVFEHRVLWGNVGEVLKVRECTFRKKLHGVDAHIAKQIEEKAKLGYLYKKAVITADCRVVFGKAVADGEWFNDYPAWEDGLPNIVKLLQEKWQTAKENEKRRVAEVDVKSGINKMSESVTAPSAYF